MSILVVVAAIVIVYSIVKPIMNRKKWIKNLENKIQMDVKNYIPYENLIFGVILAGITLYLLYDKSQNTIDMEYIVLALLILIIVIFRFVSQIIFLPLIDSKGILFSNGILLEWMEIKEIELKTRKANGDSVIFIGGKSGSNTVIREKIVISEYELDKFQLLVKSKTQIR